MKSAPRSPPAMDGGSVAVDSDLGVSPVEERLKLVT